MALLDCVVADLQLTGAVRGELAGLANDLGLDARRRELAHREFVNGLVDAALEDSIVTDAKLDQLCRVAALLDLDGELVTRRTNPYRLATDAVALTRGMQICFTGTAVDASGDPIERKTVLEPQARDCGLRPKDSLTKSCRLLVTADVGSLSSKLQLARRFGIPVASFADYRRALTTYAPLSVTRLSSTGVGPVCAQCGDSWMAARRPTNPLCPSCPRITRPDTSQPRPPVRTSNTAQAPLAVQTLVCTECRRTWERTRTRGREPSHCPDRAGRPAHLRR